MITVMIADKQEKVKDMFRQFLEKAGYSLNTAVSIEDKVIELEESLFQERKGDLYRAVLEAIERPLIEHVLRRTEGNQLKAARILGINRNTMRAKIRRLHINARQAKQGL